MEQVKFQCHFCPKLFDQERYRERHEDDVHRGKLKQCPHCAKEMTASSLSRHLSNKICQQTNFKATHTKTTLYGDGDIAEIKEYKVQTTVQVVVLRDGRKGIISQEMKIEDLNVRWTIDTGNFRKNKNDVSFVETYNID